MSILERQDNPFQNRDYHERQNRNIDNANKKFGAQDRRMAEMGKTDYPGSNEVTQARVGVDGTNHGSLNERLDDNELEVQNARGVFQNLALREANQDNDIQNNTAGIQVARNTASYAVKIAKSASSGSPREYFTNSTELKAKYPNGASGIYVTMNDGRMWFYDKGWQDIGNYQGTEVADKSVTNNKLANEVKLNGLDSTGGVVNLSWSLGYVANKAKENEGKYTEGDIVANPDYSISQPILVHTGDLLSVYGNIGPTASLISLWDINGTYISSIFDGTGKTQRVQVYVKTSGYVRISNRNTKLAIEDVTVERYPQLSPYSLGGWESGEISWRKLPLSWSSWSFISSDEYDVPNQIIVDASKEAYSLSRTFGVSSGTLVTVNGGIHSGAYLISKVNKTGDVLFGGALKGNGKAGTYTVYIDKSCYLRVSNDVDIMANPSVSTQKTDSQLAGKTLNILGDSYAENDTSPVEKTWHYKLAKKYGMTYNNYGVNGNGMVTPDGKGTPMVDRFNEMADGADYIIVVGGKNDYNKQLPIDEFKTGISTIIKGLVAKYISGKICFFTPWSLGDADNKEIKLSEYAQAIEDECNLFGIACFNSNKRSNITPWDADFRKKYMQSVSDVSHLNGDGHDHFLPSAEAFLNSL